MWKAWIAPLALLLAVPLAWGTQDPPKKDDKKQEKQTVEKPAGTPKEQFEKMTKEFDATMQKLVGEFRAAKTDEERDKIRTQARDLQKMPLKALELAEANAKEPFAMEAALWALERAGQDTGRVVKFLGDNFVGSPKVGMAVERVAEMPLPEVEKFLRAVLAANKDESVQGVTTLALAKQLMSQAENAEGDKAAALNKESDDLLGKASKKFASVKTADGTVGAEAKAILGLRIGKVVPDIEGVDGDGKKFKLSDYRGKVVFLDFWASWCGPCMALVPHNIDIVKRFEGKPFVLVGVNEDQAKEAMQKAVTSAKINWRSFFDEGGKIASNWRIQAFPTLILIDQNGVMRHKWVGSPGNKTIDDALAKLVADAEGAKPEAKK